jgi:uracil-DNA glycosylase family protein
VAYAHGRHGSLRVISVGSAGPQDARAPGMGRVQTTAAEFVPTTRSLPTLREAVQGCRGCDLYRDATQAVFGEGGRGAPIMLVGEQPGDAEDLAGRPFVGPAGRLLDEALDAAGIPRRAAYVTNAVKHFKFTRRGKKRIHDKPTAYQVKACRPWLEAELAVIQPAILVLLGATAAQALLGAAFRVSQRRGEVMATPHARWTVATVHPSSVLRAPDQDTRRAQRAAFFADIAALAPLYQQVGRTSAGEPGPAARR